MLAALGVVGALLLAATAFAFVQIYVNGFNNKDKYKEIEKVSGKKCDRAYKEKKGRMQVSADEGPMSCSFKLPVQGSTQRPDHRFDAHARLMKATDANIREDAFVLLALRVGAGDRYEFRVFPRTRDFEVRRKPNGALFPVAGGNGAIKGMGANNKMRLVVDNDRVRALVNGTEVADVIDPSPGDVEGGKVYFGVGNEKDTGKDTVANFDRLRLSVPTP